MRYSYTLCVVALLGLCLSGTAQSQEPQQASPAATLSVQPATQFPCSASADRKLKTFYGLWNPKPQPELGLIVHFGNPGFDCGGEPLEITVPNKQPVTLSPGAWPPGCAATTTIVPAPTDNSISNILTIIGGAGGHFTALAKRPLPQLTNKVLTIAVQCQGPEGKQTQSIKVTYQNPPRIVVSAGFLVSPGVKSYGIKATNTGVGTGGVSTVQNPITVTGDPTAQVVPFSFVNLYLSGTRQLNLSSQVGVGINPNLSTAKVEFFAAPLALAWRDFYFAPGVHFGQHEVLIGGFTVGDVVPSGFKPPTHFGIRGSFGFSISYNLKPQSKPSASSGT